MTEENASAFNAFTADWKNRIETLIKTIIVLSGGVMSITIGAYINSQTTPFPECRTSLIHLSWYLLALSLIASLLVYFILVISGAIVLTQWERRVDVNDQGRVIIDSPYWVHFLGWIFAIVALFSCIAGLGLTAYGASHLFQ